MTHYTRQSRSRAPRLHHQHRCSPRWDRIAVVTTAPLLLIGATLAAVDDDDDGSSIQAATLVSAPAETTPATAPNSGDLANCHLDVHQVTVGNSGDNVTCVQRALKETGDYNGEITGYFDAATEQAVSDYQAANSLYVDGIVGGNTAEALGVWPGDEWFIVRTPTPPKGATDLIGMPLSPVASAGDDAPPVPEHGGEGTGKRVVYSRTAQRVWAIDDDERIVRSYLVSGSRHNNEVIGQHKIYSRSDVSTSWDGKSQLMFMVRWLKTKDSAIGFHQIPVKANGQAYQTIDDLGTPLSDGCQRQALDDAKFMWEFGEEGTPVWVL